MHGICSCLLGALPGTPAQMHPGASWTGLGLHSGVPRPWVLTVGLSSLQEDYHKLLTKYAEAENTIDQLRLGAKVPGCGKGRAQGPGPQEVTPPELPETLEIVEPQRLCPTPWP